MTPFGHSGPTCWMGIGAEAEADRRRAKGSYQLHPEIMVSGSSMGLAMARAAGEATDDSAAIRSPSHVKMWEAIDLACE